MRLAIGMGIVALGIVLLVLGFNASDSIASDFSRFFTGNPTDRSMWFLTGGVVAVVAGLAAAFLPARRLAR